MLMGAIAASLQKIKKLWLLCKFNIKGDIFIRVYGEKEKVT
jgi:hypothetical protein